MATTHDGVQPEARLAGDVGALNRQPVKYSGGLENDSASRVVRITTVTIYNNRQ